jgi:hypothetical protein
MIKLKEVHGLYDREHKRKNWPWNQDHLDVEVDWDIYDLPSAYEMIPHADGIFFVRTLPDGVRSFIHHSHDLSKNDGGALGGKVTLTDGTEITVPGAWSSGSYHYNDVTLNDHLTEISLWGPRYKNSAMYAHLSVAVVHTLLADTEYMLVRGMQEKHVYNIIHRDDKQEFKEKNGSRI